MFLTIIMGLLPLLLQLFEFLYARNHPTPTPAPTGDSPLQPAPVSFGLRPLQQAHLALAISRMRKIVDLANADSQLSAAIREADVADDQVDSIRDKYK